ncbi:MAG: AraC family transcriptional regulator [Eubacteriales bacterium]|nr:AraC family transcriptional regulator [Eubacteriales bacterium]
MQFNISIPEQKDKSLQLLGNPRLLYTGKWEQPSLLLPRNLHRHTDAVEFVYILSGQGICELDGKIYPISGGDLIVYNSGVLHDEHISPNAIPMLCVAATGIQLPSLPPNCLFSEEIEPIFHLGSKAQMFRRLINLIFQEAASSDPRCGTACQSLFLAFLHMTLDVIDSQQLANHPDAAQGNDLGYRIRAYVDAHIKEKLSVQGIAKTFDISTSYLARVFKQTSGSPLTTYILRRRIGEAQTLLLHTDHSIAEISREVGYDNQSYFTKLFTQTAGVSPLRYRKIYGTSYKNMSDSSDESKV